MIVRGQTPLVVEQTRTAQCQLLGAFSTVRAGSAARLLLVVGLFHERDKPQRQYVQYCLELVLDVIVEVIGDQELVDRREFLGVRFQLLVLRLALLLVLHLGVLARLHLGQGLPVKRGPLFVLFSAPEPAPLLRVAEVPADGALLARSVAARVAAPVLLEQHRRPALRLHPRPARAPPALRRSAVLARSAPIQLRYLCLHRLQLRLALRRLHLLHLRLHLQQLRLFFRRLAIPGARHHLVIRRLAIPHDSRQ